ncbi:MAG: 50S ribosomal protein L29 [Chitinophagaceae bacterium]|nr:50S ribosomal protein L29 [Bacteroidota bacterium]MCC6258747.1 50S ribosomal protein L29 [Chitinophagaceae bacterium]MCW5917048.1 50S ribosomal protein L29 [Ferruginibacter sp.]
MSKRINFLTSLKGISAEDLSAKIQEDELRLKKLRFAHAVTPLENPQSIKFLRRDIARMKTALKKIQIGA